MKISNEGLDLIAKYEGCVLTAYKCPAGVWTIGYGHTGTDVIPGKKITKITALSLLQQDVERFENYINRKVKRQLKQNEFDALVSFCYNVGYRLNGDLLKYIEDGNTDGVVTKLNLYNKAKGKVLNGLVKRRKEESELYARA